MILLWLIFWALAGQPSIGGWWLVTLVLVAIWEVTPGRSK